MPAGGDASGALQARLSCRARLRDSIRRFFAARGVIEVDTPALSAAANPDPAVEPLTTAPASLGGRTQYLQTSPEFAMKRLLAAGSGDIYQLCRVFRDRELGRWHEPEFLLLEWYRIGFDDDRLMDEVAALLNDCLADAGGPLPVVRESYGDICRRELGVDPHGAPDAVVAGISDRLAAAGIPMPAALGPDGCLDLAIATVIAPALPRRTIVFIHDYPASQAALARIKPTAPPVAARFEVFVDGIELGNGFHELVDAAEQRRRFERDCELRRAAGAPALPVDEQFLAALEHGLPDCAGVAIGFDRLVAIASGAGRLAEAIDLPHAPPA